MKENKIAFALLLPTWKILSFFFLRPSNTVKIIEHFEIFMIVTERPLIGDRNW